MSYENKLKLTLAICTMMVVAFILVPVEVLAVLFTILTVLSLAAYAIVGSIYLSINLIHGKDTIYLDWLPLSVLIMLAAALEAFRRFYN